MNFLGNFLLISQSMIRLIDITKDTYTNKSGYSLFLVLEPYLKDNKQVVLSFENASPTSSSFLNSSFGSLINEFGLNTFKSLVKPVKLPNYQVKILNKYISTFNS